MSTYITGDLKRAIMSLKRGMVPAIKVRIHEMPDEHLDHLICKQSKCNWHHCLDGSNVIWVYQDQVLQEVIEYIESNNDSPLYLWAHLKMQGFSDSKVIECLKDAKQDAE